MSTLCRSTSPDDDACFKERGHKGRWHQGHQPGKRHPTRRWEGGVRSPARWEDDGCMSMADEMTWGRGVRNGRW
jgi:hypothetical protein